MDDDDYYWLIENDDDDQEPCDHENADIDILSGRMSCSCGFSKYLTGEELRIEQELQRQAYEAWDKLCEQEQSK